MPNGDIVSDLKISLEEPQKNHLVSLKDRSGTGAVKQINLDITNNRWTSGLDSGKLIFNKKRPKFSLKKEIENYII